MVVALLGFRASWKVLMLPFLMRFSFVLAMCVGTVGLPSAAFAQDVRGPSGGEFRFEKVEFESGSESLFSKAVRVHGYYSPAATESPVGIAILNPACEGLMTPDGAQVKRKYFRMAKYLATGGFAVMAVDGFNPRGASEICTKPKLMKESDRFLDALAGLKYLRQRPELRELPAVAVGWGAAGVIPGFQIAAEPAQFAAGIAYYGECEKVPTPFRPAAPLLIMGGDKDEWNPVRFCVALASQSDRNAPAMEVHVMENAYHAFDNPQGEPKPNTVNPKLGMAGRSEAATKESFQLVSAFLARHFGFKPKAGL
jgi:dienelactone hydrolase